MLVGHLGKDPDLRLLDDHVAVVSFPLATCETVMKQGIRTEQTEWHNIVMWRSLAECAARRLSKGKLVFLEGKAHTRSFEDNTGVKKYITEIVAESFTLLGRQSDFVAEPTIENERDKESISARKG